ncbi:BRO family protein [Streptosporangium sp. NPDC051022]|uniref:BRO family protein n=1 Tax=Streptosporangium sp. NPDC051022 TaxID=3155752 RepID=UPI003428AB01
MTELSFFAGPSANLHGESGVVRYPETGQSLRWVRLDGVLWMHFGDICKGTGHSNPRSAIHLVEEEDKRKIDMRTISAGQTAVRFPTPGTGNSEAWFVNEDGFATIGLAGRGDGPKVFRRWVVKVAIPQLRQTKRDVTRKELALMILAAEEELERAHLQIEADKPKVEVFDAWFDPENAVETTDFAKRLGLRSAQELNKLMQQCGIVRKDTNPRTRQARNLPTADWVHCFKVVPTRIPTGAFVDVAWILPQGQLEIVEELRNHGLIDV